MKKILLLATGGTIASKATEAGLVPQITSEELLSFVPEVASICAVDTMQVCNLDSTNLRYPEWLKIAKAVEAHYANYDGFVVTHGTDTMAYTAAALSYLIQNSRKPVVLTGSQKSIYSRDTDARSNLISAFLFAADYRANGVHIVFDNKVILGTRARKTRTKSYNAFSSIDFPEIARIREGVLYYYIEEKVEGEPVFYHALNPQVYVLKLIPGMDPAIFGYLKAHYDALVIESFGVGGLPCYDDADFTEAIRDFLDAGKTIVMTTQVPHEGSDMGVYEVGYRVKETYDLIEAYDMTIEAVTTKLMWILSLTSDREEIKRLFYRPVQKDIVFQASN